MVPTQRLIGWGSSNAVLLRLLPRWDLRFYQSSEKITILKIREVFRALTMSEIRC